jgi:hypothetical protein
VGGDPRVLGFLPLVGAILLTACGPSPAAPGASSSAATSVHASGPVAQASFKTASEAAIDTINRYEARQNPPGPKYSSGNCQPTSQQACLTGGQVTHGVHAAYATFEEFGTGGGARCSAYVYENARGWHGRNAVCTQNTGWAPDLGPYHIVTVPGACANVRDAAGLSGRILTCLPDGTLFELDSGPTFIDDDPNSTGPIHGRLWWHIKGKGWVAHELIDHYQESSQGQEVAVLLRTPVTPT